MLERLKFSYQESAGSENLWNPLYAQLTRRWLGNEQRLPDTREKLRQMERNFDVKEFGPYHKAVVASSLILQDSMKRFKNFLTHVNSNLDLNDNWKVEEFLLSSLRIIRGYQSPPLFIHSIVESLTDKEIDYRKIPGYLIMKDIGELESEITKQTQQPIMSFKSNTIDAKLEVPDSAQDQVDNTTDREESDRITTDPTILMQEDPTGIRALHWFMAYQDVYIRLNPKTLLPFAYGRFTAAQRYHTILPDKA